VKELEEQKKKKKNHVVNAIEMKSKGNAVLCSHAWLAYSSQRQRITIPGCAHYL